MGWTKGKPRHAAVRPPRGYRTVSEFLAAVRSYCAARRGGRGRHGRLQALADFCGVNQTTLSAQLAGRWIPSQDRICQIAEWFRDEHKRSNL